MGGGCPGVRLDVLVGKVGMPWHPVPELGAAAEVVQPCSVVTWSEPVAGGHHELNCLIRRALARPLVLSMSR